MDLYEVTQILCFLLAIVAGLVLTSTMAEEDTGRAAHGVDFESNRLWFAMLIYVACGVAAAWKHHDDYLKWLTDALPNKGEPINALYSLALFFGITSLMLVGGLVLLYYVQKLLITYRKKRDAHPSGN
jgi:hypothetical protein